MKPEEILSLAVMLAIIILLALCVTSISKVERELSELRVQLQKSSRVSVSTMRARTPPTRTHVTDDDTESDHLLVGTRVGHVNISANTTHLSVCAFQWLEGRLAVREMLDCFVH